MIELNIIHVPKDFSEASEGFCFFSPQRLSRIQSAHCKETALLFCAAELAVALCQKEEITLNKKAVYSYDPNGKPTVGSGFISISHSGEYALCAASNTPIGCDIEKERIVKDSTKKFITNRDDIYPYNNIIALWTVKEAYLKLTGAGIRQPMNKLTVEKGTITDSSKKAGYITTEFKTDYFISICTHDADSLEKYIINEYTYSQAIEELKRCITSKE